MSRRNHRNSKPQARRREDGSKGQRNTHVRVPLEQMIVPKGKCYFRSRGGKMIFTQEEARAALKQAQTGRRRAGSAYAEKRVYECPEGGCGGWHLTSRETYEERGR